MYSLLLTFCPVLLCSCYSLEKKEAAPSSTNEYVVYAPAGRLGIVLDSPDKEGPIVYVIKENSPLFEAIDVGDRLIAVDEVDVRQMSPTKVSKLIGKRSSNPMRKLTLLRNKEPEMTVVFEQDGTDAGAASADIEDAGGTEEIAADTASLHSRDPPAV
jgi:C-terminal processing protease CtpA/Prc